jgi:hypothetical protein
MAGAKAYAAKFAISPTITAKLVREISTEAL